MIKYHRPYGNTKPDPRMERFLPPILELDTPIPEELSLDYDLAKYDILGSVNLEENMQEPYKDIWIKYNTLSTFMFIKSDVYRKMNDRLIKSVEINLFPLILEATILHEQNPAKYKEFMISINGAKRKKFSRSTATQIFERFKSRILLGCLDSSNCFVMPDDRLFDSNYV